LFFEWSGPHRVLPSFPTRRSSDLVAVVSGRTAAVSVGMVSLEISVSARTGSSPGSLIGVSTCAWSDGAPSVSKKNKTKNRSTLRLIVGFLRFSENFTNLRKVIAICLNIELTVRNIGITCILLAITLLNSASSIRHKEFKLSKVVVDAGHGGHDPGTHGRKYKEKDIALAIALKVGKYIEQNVPGVQVV